MVLPEATQSLIVLKYTVINKTDQQLYLFTYLPDIFLIVMLLLFSSKATSRFAGLQCPQHPLQPTNMACLVEVMLIYLMTLQNVNEWDMVFTAVHGYTMVLMTFITEYIFFLIFCWHIKSMEWKLQLFILLLVFTIMIWYISF